MPHLRHPSFLSAFMAFSFDYGLTVGRCSGIIIM